LAGEIKPVSKIEQRILEAEKLGYKTFIVSKYNKITSKKYSIKLILVGKIEEAFASLFA
jgi:DNA repair protein RadA/Sms